VPSNPDFRLIIECDGFRYHSEKGFIVLRFSGHEIYHDPVGKALELLDYFLENTDLSLFEGKD